MSCKDVHVRLNYCQEEQQAYSPRPASYRASTKHGPLETIQDVRGAHEDFNLDLCGFRYVKAPTDFRDWGSELAIRNVFVPEMEDLLRQELEGCDEIHIVGIKQQQRGSERECSRMVHVDHTVSDVESMLHQKYKSKSEYLLTGRIRLVNIWKFVNCVVQGDPTAVADGRGPDPQRDISSPDPDIPIGVGRYQEGRHWYYMSEQGEEDVLLFKTYDSDQAVPSKACLRTVFNMPRPTTNNVCSTAIEIQALVFTHPTSEQATHGQQLEEVESLRSELSTLSDEVSHNEALVRAVLDLRQWESMKVAEQMHHLMSDRDHSRVDMHQAARFNHSCSPNVYHRYNPNIDRLTIHALRDIQPGEEICTAYIDICNDTAERRRVLRHWGFLCRCTACEAHDPARESRRNKLAGLMTTMQRRENKRSFENWGTWDYAEALTTVEEIITLMLEDGLEETDTLGEAYENASEYNLAMGCKEDAIKWAEKDLEVERKCCGEDSAEYAKALALLESAWAT